MREKAYLTVKGYGEREIVIQKSRFIAQVNRVQTEEEASVFVREIKKKHWSATHNCSAYTIGGMHGIQKANDDGEPGGTAGIPILEVIKKRELKNTVIVVTRYFGGTKLGAGGLIRAYGRAASEGLDAAGVVQRELMRSMVAGFDYTWLGKIENELGGTTYRPKSTQYTDKVVMEILVPVDQEGGFTDWAANLTNGQIDIRKGQTEYVEYEI